MRLGVGVLLGVLAGCGGRGANCVFDVEGTPICMGDMSMSYCRDTYGGEPTVADSTDDPTCGDLGFPVECQGVSFEEVGEGFSATYSYFFAADEAGCQAVDGAVLDHAG